MMCLVCTPVLHTCLCIHIPPMHHPMRKWLTPWCALHFVLVLFADWWHRSCDHRNRQYIRKVHKPRLVRFSEEMCVSSRCSMVMD
jgi:hypothetical protein